MSLSASIICTYLLYTCTLTPSGDYDDDYTGYDGEREATTIGFDYDIITTPSSYNVSPRVRIFHGIQLHVYSPTEKKYNSK